MPQKKEGAELLQEIKEDYKEQVNCEVCLAALPDGDDLDFFKRSLRMLVNEDHL